MSGPNNVLLPQQNLSSKWTSRRCSTFSHEKHFHVVECTTCWCWCDATISSSDRAMGGFLETSISTSPYRDVNMICCSVAVHSCYCWQSNGGLSAVNMLQGTETIMGLCGNSAMFKNYLPAIRQIISLFLRSCIVSCYSPTKWDCWKPTEIRRPVCLSLGYQYLVSLHR